MEGIDILVRAERFLLEKTHAHLNYDGDLLQRLEQGYNAQARTHERIPIRMHRDINPFSSYPYTLTCVNSI